MPRRKGTCESCHKGPRCLMRLHGQGPSLCFRCYKREWHRERSALVRVARQPALCPHCGHALPRAAPPA